MLYEKLSAPKLTPPYRPSPSLGTKPMDIGQPALPYFPWVQLTHRYSVARKFFTAPDAQTVIESHQESFAGLVYAKDARLLRFNAGPQGSLRAFIESDTRTPRLPIFTKDQMTRGEKEFGVHGFDGPMNYYRVNLNEEAAEDDKSSFHPFFLYESSLPDDGVIFST